MSADAPASALQQHFALNMKYQFEQFELDTETHELTLAGDVIGLEPQVFALLELLIANANRAVSKDEINERVWGGRIVSDAAVNSRIRTARQALNDNGKEQRLIKTIREHGFRFMAKVTSPTAQSSVSVVPIEAPLHGALSPPSDGKPSIAVLPLKLLSLDTRYEPLADAIAHELIADLSRLRWLHVISRASSFKLRDGDDNLTDVASVLGVNYVLSGTLALFGDTANISITLTDTRSGTVVWGENVESSLDELIALRTQLATRIANAIELRIQTQEAESSRLIATENLDAWMAYFRGLRHAHRFNAYDNEIAQHLFEHAIALDSQFSLAHAGLSFTHFQNAFVNYVDTIDDSQRQALVTAEKAFELDPLDPVVNLMMGRAKYLNGHWEQAGPWFDRCATLSPNNALAYYHQALTHVMSGETADITDLTRQALSLSPIDPLQYAFLATRAMGHISEGDGEQAAHWADQAANAPRAHHLIDVVAAVSNEIDGNSSQAEFRRQRILERAPNFESSQFFRSFPIRDDGMRNRVTQSLKHLGFR